MKKLKAGVDNTLPDSSYPTKAKFNIKCFIIHSKYFPALYNFFAKITQPLSSSPGFLSQRFNNLQQAALLTSF